MSSSKIIDSLEMMIVQSSLNPYQTLLQKVIGNGQRCTAVIDYSMLVMGGNVCPCQ